MSQFPEISSNLSTANFRASILTLASQISGWNIPAYTSITLGSYSGTNPTIIKYWSGQNGTGNLLATLTLGYDGSSNLTSISRS
jgi:hypothetical protein